MADVRNGHDFNLTLVFLLHEFDFRRARSSEATRLLVVCRLIIDGGVNIHANWVTSFECLMNNVSANEASGPSDLYHLNEPLITERIAFVITHQNARKSLRHVVASDE